jgi:hypothetical protein
MCIFAGGQAAGAKPVIDIPDPDDDSLFDLITTSAGSDQSSSSAQHSNPDGGGGNEHGSSMCALWCSSSTRYVHRFVYISRHYIPSWLVT